MKTTGVARGSLTKVASYAVTALKIAGELVVAIFRTAASLLWALIRRTSHAATLVPKLIRKPAILYRWLLSAHLAQAALVFVVLTMPSYIPSLLDERFEERYPPITSERMFGLVRDSSPDPHLDQSRKQARIVLWTGSGFLILYLLLLHIPAGINRATALARKREREADALADSQPSAGIMLYNSALSLVSDPAYESGLRSKLDALDKRLSEMGEKGSGGGAIARPPLSVEETVKLDSDPTQSAPIPGEQSAQMFEPYGEGVGPENRYLLREELGRGAMGIVYRAYDRVLARDVALKQLPLYLSSEQPLVERFQQEARALARLSHPCIVQVYDFVQDKDQSWIAMEFVEGEELERRLNESGALSVKETVRLGIQLAEALAYAHDRGVIHRDFKPANVLLTKDGVPKITDFGLAKLAQSSLHTQEGATLGTPAYMSPEQALSKGTDSRSDIYAFGVTLYKMLSASLPFEGSMESVIAQKLTQNPAPLSKFKKRIPKVLGQLVAHMLEKEPDNRPESMSAVADALKAVSRA